MLAIGTFKPSVQFYDTSFDHLKLLDDIDLGNYSTKQLLLIADTMSSDDSRSRQLCNTTFNGCDHI